MDDWLNLKLKFEEALEMVLLEEALSHLESLITISSAPSDVPDLLTNHTLDDSPTLNYLAFYPFQEEDIHHLDKLIKIFTESGYDINKMSHQTWFDGDKEEPLKTPGFTALLEAVDMQNPILVECLLRHGARADIRDDYGLTPCHRAIINDHLNCLKKLVEFGGPSVLKSTSVERHGEGGVLPLLHMAVVQGRTEIVRYLLTKVELGIDVNEVAISHFEGGFRRPETPLRIALDIGCTPIIEALMEHPGTTPSRFGQLHSFLTNSMWEEALSLLKYFSDEELSTYKIWGEWALLSVVPFRFGVGFAKLIVEFVKRGWDVNSVSNAKTLRRMPLLLVGSPRFVSLRKYTLLHLACMDPQEEIIKALVEEAGADVNCKTTGKAELTPLHILLLRGKYEDAEYLIGKGADVNLRGSLDKLEGTMFTRFMRRNLVTGSLEMDRTFSSLELVVRLGSDNGTPLLDKLLVKNDDVELVGSNLFHLAIEGSNPIHVSKVLQHCAKLISKEDLNSMTLWAEGNPIQVAPLIVFFSGLVFQRIDLSEEAVNTLGGLVKQLGRLGHDLHGPEECPLILFVLNHHLLHPTSTLRTILQFDQLKLNVTNRHGLGINLMEYLLEKWNLPSICLKDRQLPPSFLEAVQLLLSHGLDVSGVVIGPNFMYHKGSKDVIKMLYSAGAKISNEFFTYTRKCPRISDANGAFTNEIRELKNWKDDFDRGTGFTLRHISGVRVRKMLKCVGDRKILDGLPKGLKEDVLEISIDLNEGNEELEWI